MQKKKLLVMLIAVMTMSFVAASCGDDDEPSRTTNTQQGSNNGNNSGTNNGNNGGNTPNDSTSNSGNNDNGNPTNPVQDPEQSVRAYIGGDISMLTKYEQQRAAYADQNGNAISDVISFLKQQGWNTMRVRLFVDPSKSNDKAVCQDLNYVVALGKRIKQAGLQLMLDLHYSDTWADPGKQWTPAAWLQYNDTQLQTTVYEYTRECLQQLVAANATPDLIQTGNEISYGMLWGATGTQDNRCYTNSSAGNWARFIALLKQAGKACREVCPQAKIIIHSERVPRASVLCDFFDRMRTAQLDYDVIGLSYYPYFHGKLDVLDTALKQLEAKNYGKQIQIVETGYPSQWAVEGSTIDCTDVYPYTEQGQLKFTNELIALLKQHPQVNGISWWYAEANAKGCNGNLATGWYNAGLFNNNNGRALPALYALKNLQ